MSGTNGRPSLVVEASVEQAANFAALADNASAIERSRLSVGSELIEGSGRAYPVLALGGGSEAGVKLVDSILAG